MRVKKESRSFLKERKVVTEMLAKNCKSLISPNIFSAENFKRRSRKVEWDDQEGGKPITEWKNENLGGDIIASSLPELAQKFMSFVSEHSGDKESATRTPFVDVKNNKFTVLISETRKGKPLTDIENGKQFFEREYSCSVSMMNDISEVLSDFANIRGQLEHN